MSTPPIKTVYFVRHGESEANAGKHIYHGHLPPLTDKGREQARFIGNRCRTLDVDVLIASPMVRAQQTAEFISETTSLPIETNELFAERRPPTELEHASNDDPRAVEMHRAWNLSFLQDGARVSNGENFTDLKLRVSQALQHLRERSEERILVVSHGFFLHMTAAIVLLGESLTAKEFNLLSPAIWMDNTGLTRIEYREQAFPRTDGKRHTDWTLRVWNDHAHLG